MWQSPPSLLEIEKRVSYLLDKEDEETVVDDSFEAFQAMYQPVLQENFKDLMELRDGKFLIDIDDKATQKRLLMEVNDNVHKNLDGFSIKLFDKDLRRHKKEFSPDEKEVVVDKLV